MPPLPLLRPPFLCPLLLDCRLPSRFLVPSHRLGHNLFRLQLSFRVPFFFPSLFLQSSIIPQIARLFNHPESPVVLAPQPDALRSILVFVFSFSRIPFKSAIFLPPRVDIHVTLNFFLYADYFVCVSAVYKIQSISPK